MLPYGTGNCFFATLLAVSELIGSANSACGHPTVDTLWPREKVPAVERQGVDRIQGPVWSILVADQL